MIRYHLCDPSIHYQRMRTPFQRIRIATSDCLEHWQVEEVNFAIPYYCGCAIVDRSERPTYEMKEEGDQEDGRESQDMPAAPARWSIELLFG